MTLRKKLRLDIFIKKMSVMSEKTKLGKVCKNPSSSPWCLLRGSRCGVIVKCILVYTCPIWGGGEGLLISRCVNACTYQNHKENGQNLTGNYNSKELIWHKSLYTNKRKSEHCCFKSPPSCLLARKGTQRQGAPAYFQRMRKERM